MAFNNDDKPSFPVDMECARCGAHISSLPFEPSDPSRKVYCEKCNREYWQTKRQNGFDQRPKQKFQVDVNCAECGTHISELPFQPREGGKDILCSNCLRAKRDRAA